ncbi:MAG: rhamnogalacturonate lyase [Lachnospiraceae bacterium]|nr:rhamnogalacturonate lyase [Lachnospiraceae bacterium]
MTDVTLKVENNTCVMDNGILSITWKEDASVASLLKDGIELLKEVDPITKETITRHTFYVDYHAEGKFRKFYVSSLNVITNTPDMAHICYIDTHGLLYLEYHIIMMKGMSGIYSYVIAKNNTDSEFTLSELRTVYRFGTKIFDHGCNSERIGLQPTHKYMEQYECLQDETYRLPDGEKYTNGDVYSKYDYASYFSTNKAWGQFGHNYGFFVIPVCTDYYPSGPLKQELLVHYDGIVLNYFTGAHFGTGPFHVPMNWEKCYGPFFLYFNEGKDGPALYQDALAVAAKEQTKWPYSWVNDPLYPLIRSTVTGKLILSDGTGCHNTTVVLAKKGLCFEKQTADYIYYTTTDDAGRFTLDHVRFGSYSLYAYQTGGDVTEQFEADDISIQNKHVSLPDMTFCVPRRKKIWQIGTATRTSDGFVFGGELRNYKWSQMVPANLTYTIGISNDHADWYYAQTKPGIWNINFSFSPKENASYVLIIALSGVCAGSMTGRTEPYYAVKLNNSLIKEVTFLNDSSVYRSATRNGRYRRLVIPISASLLTQGDNTISLCVDNCMIMYDTILFEQESDSACKPLS